MRVMTRNININNNRNDEKKKKEKRKTKKKKESAQDVRVLDPAGLGTGRKFLVDYILPGHLLRR